MAVDCEHQSAVTESNTSMHLTDESTCLHASTAVPASALHFFYIAGQKDGASYNHVPLFQAVLVDSLRFAGLVVVTTVPTLQGVEESSCLTSSLVDGEVRAPAAEHQPCLQHGSAERLRKQQCTGKERH